MIEGQIALHSTLIVAPKDGKGANVASLNPGTKVQWKQLTGQYGRLSSVLQCDVLMEASHFVGLDCCVLSMTAPHTYITNTDCVALVVDADTLIALFKKICPAALNSLSKKLCQDVNMIHGVVDMAQKQVVERMSRGETQE